MPQIILMIKDDIHVVSELSCFVGQPVVDNKGLVCTLVVLF